MFDPAARTALIDPSAPWPRAACFSPSRV